MPIEMKSVYGVGKDILTLLILPAIAIIIKQQVDKAVMEEHITVLQAQVVDLQKGAEVQKALEIGQKNSESLARMEEKLDGVSQNFSELRTDVREVLRGR